AAERDVLSVAQRRWPEVRFEVRNTAVQGPTAVAQVVEALAELDADPRIDVIIVARGGGSVEDLLPCSDAPLCRAVHRATTLVADVRAAAPTDAAKTVVPDVVAERALITDLRTRSAGALRAWVRREQHGLAQMRSRPVLADPARSLAERAEHVDRMRESARRE